MSNQSENGQRLTGLVRGIRVIFFSFAVLGILVVMLLVAGWIAQQNAKSARARWKGPALERLAGMSITNEEIRLEIEKLSVGPDDRNNARWAGEHVLVMTNGDYIMFVSRHGRNNGFVDHLFLGHASDGRWLYSTYHFCNSMAAILGEHPPGSIDEFERRFSVREFDGKSDECLRRTWPQKE